MRVNSYKRKDFKEDDAEKFDLKSTITKVLQHPTVASKSFLITIGDRTVGGMVARDQFVGPYQVPVSDYSPQRLQERTTYDIEMMRELGYCQGITDSIVIASTGTS